jgi:uncharacterized membrane protein YkoI
MSRTIITIFIAIAVLLSPGLKADEEIALDQVPDAVIQAAIAELPGFRITEASVETEDDMLVYELEGEAEGKEYEIEVSADGRILEIDEDD